LIKGVDAAALAETARGSFKPLERGANLFRSFQDGETNFTSLEATYTIKGGIVNFSKINFDGPKASIDTTGQVNLPNWTLDLKNTMTVKNTDIPPFEFSISGPLDNPLQTGGSVIENYLRGKAQQKIQKFIGDELQKRLGLPQAEPAPSPADGSAAPSNLEAPPTEAPQKTPGEALQNIIQNPNKIDPNDAAKALEGLFR
jgi:hypothetical protein